MESESQPNLVFIMSDDHAAHAISAYGSRINHTPNLDRIATEGMRLDEHFAGARCRVGQIDIFENLGTARF